MRNLFLISLLIATTVLADSSINIPGGITSFNGQTGNTQSLVSGSAGSDFNISSAANTTTINLPTASAVNRGALSSADWSTFNAKQAAGSYITALTGDLVANGPGSVNGVLANSAHNWYVDFGAGNDSTGTGSSIRPWKTLQHACTAISGLVSINLPGTIHLSGGNNDSDVGTITCAPNINLVSDYSIQINQPYVVTGGSLNDTVSFINIIFSSTWTWVRNDTTNIQATFINSETTGLLDFEQQGSGVGASFLFMLNGGFGGGLTIRAGQADLYALGVASGTFNYKDSGAAFLLVQADDLFNLTMQLNGGITAQFAGNIADTGYTIAGTTTGSGTPTVVTDSASLPASVSGVTVLGNEARVLAGSNASPATNASLIVNDGHIKSTQTTAPTATVKAAAGTGASCSVSHATDSAGQISLTTTNVASSTGDYCDVNFNKAYGVAPICTISPGNAVTANNSGPPHEIYSTSSTSALSINFGVAENTGSSYVWNYHCIETQ